ncbi:MAG: hypothetical protein IPH76_16690 [Xanthomonadales bacterium]|nr:hypothetical protein [Xanthomonadales bacterium]
MSSPLAHKEGSIESRRQAMQAAIDSGKPAIERNRLGQFATPYPLAVEIARYVRSLVGSPEGGIRFADPSIGSGSFFSAALAVFGSDGIRSSIGVEIDSAFADAARKLWTDAGLDVVRGDFTRIVAADPCPPAPNVILANPPYHVPSHHYRPGRRRSV